MNKTQMIAWLRENFGSWGEVLGYCHVSNFNCVLKPHGWFISVDGPEKSDVYLCTKDPRGDDEGETITARDFEAEQVKPEIDHWVKTHENGKELFIPLRASLTATARNDLNLHGVKSKFRPVYKKESTCNQ